MKLIDSHCHIDFPQFDEDRAAVLAAAQEVGVQQIIVPGVKAASWDRQQAFCQADERLQIALGLHPYFIDEHTEYHLEQLDQVLKESRPVAVGEIGLDYYLAELDRDKQQHFFSAQLDLAEQHQLPVILHVRKAHDEVLKQLRSRRLSGTVHAFSGSEQQAEQYIRLGFKLGFGGAVTYERANRLRRLVASLPLNAIVLETDAPDMSPALHHNQRNEPSFLSEVLAVVAQLRGEPAEIIAQQTTQTVEELFALSVR